MILIHLAIPMIFVMWDFQNKSIFHRHSQFDAKMTSFCIVQAAIYKSFFALRISSHLIHVPRLFCAPVRKIMALGRKMVALRRSILIERRMHDKRFSHGLRV